MNSINEIKIAQAKAYLAMYADPQTARDAAAKNGEIISAIQWEAAEKKPEQQTTNDEKRKMTSK